MRATTELARGQGAVCATDPAASSSHRSSRYAGSPGGYRRAGAGGHSVLSTDFGRIRARDGTRSTEHALTLIAGPLLASFLRELGADDLGFSRQRRVSTS